MGAGLRGGSGAHRHARGRTSIVTRAPVSSAPAARRGRPMPYAFLPTDASGRGGRAPHRPRGGRGRPRRGSAARARSAPASTRCARRSRSSAASCASSARSAATPGAENAAPARRGRGLSALRDAGGPARHRRGARRGRGGGPARARCLSPFRATPPPTTTAAEARPLPPSRRRWTGSATAPRRWRVKGDGWAALEPGPARHLAGGPRARCARRRARRRSPRPPTNGASAPRTTGTRPASCRRLWPDADGPTRGGRRRAWARRWATSTTSTSCAARLGGRPTSPPTSRDEAQARAAARRADLWAEAEADRPPPLRREAGGARAPLGRAGGTCATRRGSGRSGLDPPRARAARPARPRSARTVSSTP